MSLLHLSVNTSKESFDIDVFVCGVTCIGTGLST